jgi:hypothetical protein
MILALAQHIFAYGTNGRFYSQIRKHHHAGGKVCWSMDPTPETTTLVNRCDEAQTYEARLAAGALPKWQGDLDLGRPQRVCKRPIPTVLLHPHTQAVAARYG